MEKKTLTLGSLFSGSGGFELGGIIAGVKPVWKSEIEPFAVLVTHKRLPQVRHYGDVSAIKGSELEPVDIITWGSPCQDLSISGKRAGLGGSRSSLYFQAVRIAKEMLESTGGEYPKFCVFENVPGLLSSNKGEDFKTALDMMQGIGFIPDINILDAQYMGVPQRRKRVYITWVSADYILRKRTNISDSIMLQLLTEISLMNLEELLRASGAGLKKSGAQSQSQYADLVQRRINLFSLQKEGSLQKWQERLDGIQAMSLSGRTGSDSSHGEDLKAAIMSQTGGTRSAVSTKGSQYTSIGQSLRTALEESCRLMSGCTTSTLTSGTTGQRICFYFQVLRDTLLVTRRLMHSLERTPMCLNFYEWAQYVLTEIKECTDAGKKYFESNGDVEWHELFRSYKQELQEIGNSIERYLGEQRGEEVLPLAQSMSGYTPQGFRPWQGTAGSVEEGAGETGRRPDTGSGDGVTYCMNPQGNSGVGITEDKTLALVTQDHGNHPSVLQAAGFSTEHSAQSRSIGYEEETSPTLRAGVVPAAMASATLGTHNDQTLFQPAYGIAKEAFNTGEKAGFNFAVNKEVSPTIQAHGAHAVAKPKAYGVCSKSSHAMLSDNPHSGFYEAETSRTLDQGGGNPTCNQGGICIVAPTPEDKKTYDVRFTSEDTKNVRGHCYKTDISRCLDTGGENPESNHGGVAVVEKQPVAFTQNQRNEVRDLGKQAGALSAQPGMKQQTYVLQGSMIGRSDKNGPRGDVSFTLNTVDKHAVVTSEPTFCATTGSFMTVEKEKSHTLMARDYKDPQIINDTPSEEPLYIVRRLTPVECARLQGFPDWWCDDLAIPNPSDEELAYWAGVWETRRKLTNPDGKPKTEKQIRKWLASPYTDAAEYKLWGNGVALPCVYFVLSGIVWADGEPA